MKAWFPYKILNLQSSLAPQEALKKLSDAIMAFADLSINKTNLFKAPPNLYKLEIKASSPYKGNIDGSHFCITNTVVRPMSFASLLNNHGSLVINGDVEKAPMGSNIHITIRLPWAYYIAFVVVTSLCLYYGHFAFAAVALVLGTWSLLGTFHPQAPIFMQFLLATLEAKEA